MSCLLLWSFITKKEAKRTKETTRNHMVEKCNEPKDKARLSLDLKICNLKAHQCMFIFV